MNLKSPWLWGGLAFVGGYAFFTSTMVLRLATGVALATGAIEASKLLQPKQG